MTNEQFKELALSKVQPGKFRPTVLYDRLNDRLEILISDESYRVERLDQVVSIYSGRETQQITGALVKGVRHFVDVAKDQPDVRFEIHDGKFNVVHFFKAMQRNRPKTNTLFNLLIQKLEEVDEENPLDANIGNLATCQ
jgi:hypothetical protein